CAGWSRAADLCCREDGPALCAYLLSVFVDGLAAHRGLHAFPTRRSSDLGGADRGGAVRARAGSHPHRGGRLGAGVHRRRLVLPRSEEHTSELQSRFDLVCRLLLEKKKQRPRPPTGVTRALNRTTTVATRQ